MTDITMIFDILRYSAQISIIYLLLRNVPYVKLTQIQSLIATIIIMALCVTIEKICINLSKSNNIIITDDKKCDTCTVEGFEEKPTKNRCRVVCDPEPDKEVTQKPIEVPQEENDKVEEGFENTDLGSRYSNISYDDRYGFGGMFYDEYPFYNRFRQNNDRSQALRDQVREEEMQNRVEKRLTSTDGFEGRYQEVGNKSEILRTTDNKRRITGDLDDEIPYTDYNHLPVASGYKSHDYEYGYSFIPPEKWYRQPPRPPICVTQQRTAVLPAYTNGAPMDVKEWHTSRRITPPDRINVAYIEDKLNGGR